MTTLSGHVPNPPLPSVLPCEEQVDPDGRVITPEVGIACGKPSTVEYLRRPQRSGHSAWVAACDEHADAREAEGLVVRPFTGIARW